VILPRDARGRPLLGDGRSLTEVPDGADLELTIDHEIQFALERELHSTVERFEATAAVGIVMDAQTSEVLAMANLPTFDVNEGSRFNNEARRNRMVTDVFEPGSTMKTFLIAAALKHQVVKPSSRYFCEGGRFKIGDKWMNEAETYEKFQWLNVSEILAVSSNIGSAKIAMDLGAEKLYQTLCDFGFGSKTGMTLPGESRGIINPLPWRPHLLANVSIGHGVAATPLQVAAAYTAIANGGVLKRPLIVKAIRSVEKKVNSEFQADEIRRVLSKEDAATLRLMLNAATEDKGTGVNARIPGFYVAGKTGTAQKVDTVKGGYSKAYISSFAGFVPAHDPRYVIYIAVDNPKKAYYGSQVAAPVFSKIAQYLVRRAGLPPAQIKESNMINPLAGSEKRRNQLQTQAMNELRKMNAQPGDEKVLPNLLGLSLREALDRVRGSEAKVEVRGSGVVVRTVPLAGAISPAKITMILENPD
jgi:cell division protein FtsI (penicillin-binding protein 3)